mmetsp:Transcript_160/g.614  ORF Transcript_160/g.614 Transcript_160/m.614 type:complete len:115 (-) Transcript_160:891-1235(-)
MTWQSMRSVIPPCPGMVAAKSLILNARLNPEAKKPPNGATALAKVPSASECTMNIEQRTVAMPVNLVARGPTTVPRNMVIGLSDTMNGSLGAQSLALREKIPRKYMSPLGGHVK